MLLGVGYWAFFGTFYLLVLTVQDFRDGMLVDDRFNWFMFGLTFSLLSHFSRPLWWAFVVLGIVLFLRWFLLRFDLVGAGDVSSLAWIFYGFGIVSVWYCLWWCLAFCFVVGLYALLKFCVFRFDKPTPFFPVILVSFVVACLLFKLY